MDYVRLARIFNIIHQKGINSVSDRYTYIIAPYLNDLGYDIFEDDDVKVYTDEGVANVYLKEGLWGQITIEEPSFEELANTWEDLSIIQHIDADNYRVVLYFKGLGKWEEASSVDISDSGYTDEHVEVFNQIKDIFDNENSFVHEDTENLFLTDFIFRAKLGNGEWNNDYLVNAIANELVEPSDDMIKVIARNISRNYTTLSSKEVYKYISKGIKESTLYNIIVEMYDLIPREEAEMYIDNDEDGSYNSDDVESYEEYGDEDYENGYSDVLDLDAI